MIHIIQKTHTKKPQWGKPVVSYSGMCDQLSARWLLWVTEWSKNSALCNYLIINKALLNTDGVKDTSLEAEAKDSTI